MIIPVRCFTCNKVLASKYETYLDLVEKNNFSTDDIVNSLDNMSSFRESVDKSKEIFGAIGINRYCCKKHLLTHVKLIEKI